MPAPAGVTVVPFIGEGLPMGRVGVMKGPPGTGGPHSGPCGAGCRLGSSGLGPALWWCAQVCGRCREGILGGKHREVACAGWEHGALPTREWRSCG